MELPQSRPDEAEEDFSTGRRKPTHDFLSACNINNSIVQPDTMPPSQGGYLKTHDFLQPLERVGTRACTKDGIRSSVDITATKVLPHVQNQHNLPGDIGTYTISHIPYSYHHHHHHNQRVPKSEVSPTFTASQASSNEGNTADENSISNCNSVYAARGMTLWDESQGKKGHAMKDNARERTNISADAATTIGQWQGIEQRGSFSSHSFLQTSGQKIRNQSFMDMMRSARGSSLEDDLDDDHDEEFVMKNKENNTSTSQCQRVDLRVKVGGGHGKEQKPNTPRSKHSATEQRRRSKINDRFQMLRKLIPNSDLKRDKASFLLEVIEYIHFLQKKVNKHEVVPYQRKPMNWRKHHQQPREGAVPVLADAQAVDMDQQCQNREMEMTHIPSFFSSAIPQLCPNSSNTAMESDKLGEEKELSLHKGTISISSVYSQGLLKTLTETLQTSGVDLSKASISVQINLSKQPQKDDEVVHRWVRPRSLSEDDNKINKKQTPKHKNLKQDNDFTDI